MKPAGLTGRYYRRMTTGLIIGVLFIITAAPVLSGPVEKDKEIVKRVTAEIEAMKLSNPSKHRDFRYALRHIRKVNRKQKESTSLVVAKALVDHVHWDRYRFESEEHRLNFLSVLMGIIRVESAYNPGAVSDKNARGLMQVHWPTWKHCFSSLDESHDLNRNISVGTGILRLYMEQSNNNLRHALYKYLGARNEGYANRVIESAIAFKKSVLADPLEPAEGDSQ